MYVVVLPKVLETHIIILNFGKMAIKTLIVVEITLAMKMSEANILKKL